MTQHSRIFAFLVTCLAALAVATAQAQSAAPTQGKANNSPPVADAIFAAWDVDKNGSLSQAEFKHGWTEMRRAVELQEALRAQFQNVDTDKNGYLDAKEYSGLMLVKKAGSAAPPFSNFDANKDQRLDFAEYVGFVKQMTAPKPAAK